MTRDGVRTWAAALGVITAVTTGAGAGILAGPTPSAVGVPASITQLAPQYTDCSTPGRVVVSLLVTDAQPGTTYTAHVELAGTRLPDPRLGVVAATASPSWRAASAEAYVELVLAPVDVARWPSATPLHLYLQPVGGTPGPDSWANTCGSRGGSPAATPQLSAVGLGGGRLAINVVNTSDAARLAAHYRYVITRTDTGATVRTGWLNGSNAVPDGSGASTIVDGLPNAAYAVQVIGDDQSGTQAGVTYPSHPHAASAWTRVAPAVVVGVLVAAGLAWLVRRRSAEPG